MGFFFFTRLTRTSPAHVKISSTINQKSTKTKSHSTKDLKYKEPTQQFQIEKWLTTVFHSEKKNKKFPTKA